ncbi:MAG TPA: zf-HC2 domain-containing protein [Bacteroidota bacterium]|nr:zf-HC2 domain-containing protein [Bacteroidota bacterium]
MSRHVQDSLYDYIAGDLRDLERQRIERHLDSCPSCRDDLEALRSALALLPRRDVQPSEMRDSAFWASFADSVERKLPSAKSRPRSYRSLGESIADFIQYNTAALLAGSGALAVIALAAILLWPREAAVESVQPNPVPQAAAIRLAPGANRVHEYLKRSKVLLVGLSNMRSNEGAPIDLSVEREQSRALVHEARYLRQQPLDMRSAKLITDIQTLMIELANAPDAQETSDIIRSGIRRQNILFKIRMTESLLEAGAKERGRQ